MTSLSKDEQSYFERQLRLLEEQRGQMNKTVDNYVNLVINAWKYWAESKEQHKLNYFSMSDRMSKSAGILTTKRKDLLADTKKEALELSEFLDRGSNLEIEILGKLLTTSSSAASATTEHTTAEKGKSFFQSGKESARQTDVTHNVPSEIWERLEENEKQVKKLTEKHDQMQNLESELQSLKNELQKLSTCHDNKLQSLKNELQKVITDQDRQDEITFRTNKDIEMKLSVMVNETKSIKAALIKNNSLVEGLSSRTESLEKEKAHLLEQISAKHETLENVLTKEERSEMAIKEIKERLVLAETGHTEFVENVQMQLKEVETNLQKVAAMSPRIKKLETKSSRPAVFFTACKVQIQKCDKGSVIASYDNVRSNIGDHFNPFSGVFTAPLDGVYVASITLMCSTICQIYILLNDHCMSTVCWAGTGPGKNHTCDLGLINMKIGDTLSAKVIENDESSTQRINIRFSCFMIG